MTKKEFIERTLMNGEMFNQNRDIYIIGLGYGAGNWNYLEFFIGYGGRLERAYHEVSMAEIQEVKAEMIAKGYHFTEDDEGYCWCTDAERWKPKEQRANDPFNYSRMFTTSKAGNLL